MYSFIPVRFSGNANNSNRFPESEGIAGIFLDLAGSCGIFAEIPGL
jgi:hypothetical protein